ncbi:hypothetical protein niasHS_002981 [Heterodera schachtii]|uniref:Uncharacterized protein n=1 Tax=Heterodera schachtii TaxID=97005 RepID=A0ABD2K9H0_HETSC
MVGVENGGDADRGGRQQLKIDEFYEVQLYAGHNIGPTAQNPLAVARTQGFIGFAFLKIVLNQQISKFTICAQKFRRKQTTIGRKIYINIAVIEQLSSGQNCVTFVSESTKDIVKSFLYNHTSTNILTLQNTLPMPKFPPHKFKFNIKIENKIFDKGTKFFFHLYCAKRENNNFYAETNLGKKEGQIEFWDGICENNMYRLGVIVAQSTANPLTFLIKEDFYVIIQCQRLMLNNNQRDINYDLVINRNGASGAEIKCHETNEKIPESKRRRIGADGAGPSGQKELPNKNRVPKITEDLLANFGNPPTIETLNLLDNFVGENQQKPAQ